MLRKTAKQIAEENNNPFHFEKELRKALKEKPTQARLERFFRMTCKYYLGSYHPVFSVKEKFYLKGFISRMTGENDEYKPTRPWLTLAYAVRYWGEFTVYLKENGYTAVFPETPTMYLLLRYCGQARGFAINCIRGVETQQTTSKKVLAHESKIKRGVVSEKCEVVETAPEDQPATYEELLRDNPDLENLQ